MATASDLDPRVTIGLPLYNGRQFLPAALDSLLNQRFDAFRLIICDDASQDDGADLAERYAALDPRIEVIRHEQRIGMVANWRLCFEEARKRYPRAEYFAWASDHDLWHPSWLSTLVRELDRRPTAIAAFPLTRGIDEQGRLLRRAKWDGLLMSDLDRAERLRLAVDEMAAGNMIYGLIRSETLERAGSFPAVLLPDRLLIARLSLYGELATVDRSLWLRRFRAGVRPSLARQRQTLFVRPPLYLRLPWWIMHMGAMVLWLAHPDRRPVGMGRSESIRVSAQYALFTMRMHLRRRRFRGSRQRALRRKALRRQSKRFRRRAKNATVRLLRRARRFVLVRVSR